MNSLYNYPVKKTKKIILDVNNTHREKLNSLQEFIKVKSWLRLIFSICLRNQLKSDSHLPKKNLFYLLQ